MSDNNLGEGRNAFDGVEVEIFGQKYIIKGEGDQEYIRELAAYVDSKMHEVHEKLKIATPAKAAVLAAINITHELLTIKKEMAEQDSAIGKEADRLLELISLEFET